MRKLLCILALPLVLLLAACGPSNQLIGKWKAEPVMGMDSTMEFTSDSYTTITRAGGFEQKQEVKVSGYKVEKGTTGDKIGVTLNQGGQSVTAWYQMVDSDTVDLPGPMITVRYHRVK